MLRLRGNDQTNMDRIDFEMATLESAVRDEAGASDRGLADFFKKDPQRLFYRLFLAIAVNFCAQMTSANVISYYGKPIFKESLLLPGKKAALLNAGVLTWKIAAATSSYLLVDRLGRKPLFMAAGAGMGISMAGLAGTVWSIDNGGGASAGIGATFFLFLFMAFSPWVSSAQTPSTVLRLLLKTSELISRLSALPLTGSSISLSLRLRLSPL